ncbi:MAG: metal-sulfur cluster assembly factor [Bdellovibrionales bacterium]|nr:metal-sulfur cluster assembly factor [Bdellovibrionales bacterium]
MTTKEEVIEILKTIEDPDLFLDIWFLGLIYGIDINDEERKVSIEMTFTTPLCPAGPMLIEQVKDQVGLLPEIDEVEVNIVFNPPWQPSEDVKAMLGMI